jgi:hypothetical protein
MHKIWSDFKEKNCCRRVVKVERGKWRNENKIWVRSSWIKRKEREKRRERRKREERKRGERKK